MKSSTKDHLKAKLKPTFFGIFEKQDASLLEKVYAYIYNKMVSYSPAISGCRGALSGGDRPVTFAMIEAEFNVYSREVQTTVLARVNNYVTDFDAATVFHLTQEQRQRLLEVRDYFQENIKEESIIQRSCN